jgi:tetratricopeptide (TPR) repeat protein
MSRVHCMAIALLLIALLPGLLLAQNAVIKEEPRLITTYPFSDPDPVPILAKNPVIYPYFAFDGFSHEGKPQTWNMVRLENPYIRAWVMPGIGGKVWGAVEKKSGREFVYMNDAVKFRRIALRGPWTSGGIEFNFGIIGHTPSTATPVDYVPRKNADGSVTCFVGTLDLPSRTRWTVAITLPKDKAYLQTRAMWYNPTPYDQSYYTWTTAAVSAREDLQYFYAGRFVVPHSNAIANDPWPVDRKGRDLSLYKNNRFEGSKSHFVFGSYNTAFGTYAHGEQLGLGHWARHEDMPGQKVWIWSLFRDGAIWENLLTDARGQYSEPQAGRLLSQVDHEFFSPYRGDAWDELWFPVKDIGGISAASPGAVMHVSQKGDSVTIQISALRPLTEDLIVADGTSERFRHKINLAPLAVYRKVLAWTESLENINVRLGNTLSWSGDTKKLELHRPLQYRQTPETSPEGLYLAGEFHEKQREYETALEKYLSCLKEEPNHVRALSRVAGLYGRRGEPEKGLTYAARALSIRKYDAQANYQYGVLARRLDHLIDAKETFGWAARSLEFGSAAYCQLAEISLQEKLNADAAEYATKALEDNAHNINASIVLALARARLGQTRKARALLDALLATDPLNHTARFARYLLEPTLSRLQECRSLIRTELPHETYLETALWFVRLGYEGEALRILSEAPPHPMVHYWRGYLLRHRDERRSKELVEMGNRRSPALVFPFREESIPVLQWASRVSPSWKTSYYLGLLLWGKGRKGDALECFDSCGTPDDFPVFFIARGLLKQQTGRADVQSDFDRAVALDRSSWRAWHFAIASLAQSGKNDEALRRARDAVDTCPGNLVLSMDLAGSLYTAGAYDECLTMLNRQNILPYEGSWEAHDLFVRANLSRALEAMAKSDWRGALASLEQSKAFPENLGTGMPDAPDYRLQDCLGAFCMEKSGMNTDASQARTRVREYTLQHGVEWGSEHYFGLRALEESGDTTAAAKLAESWEKVFPADPLLRLYQAQSSGSAQSMLIVQDTYRNDPWFLLRMKAIRLLGLAPLKGM